MASADLTVDGVSLAFSDTPLMPIDFSKFSWDLHLFTGRAYNA